MLDHEKTPPGLAPGGDPRSRADHADARIVGGGPRSSNLDDALALAGLGWYVLPTWPGRKAPATVHGHLDATIDHATIARWWRRRPRAGIGIDLERSGLLVVDLDVHRPGADGLMTMLALEARHGCPPGGPVAWTGGDGQHRYYRRPAGYAPHRAVGVRPGVDLLSRGMVLAPPSVHPSGRPYRWSIPPQGIAPPYPPAWLLDLEPPAVPPRAVPAPAARLAAHRAGPYAQTALHTEVWRAAHAPQGRRHTQLFASAAALASLAAAYARVGRSCFPPALASDLLFRAALANGLVADDGEASVRRCIADGWAAGWCSPRRGVA